MICAIFGRESPYAVPWPAQKAACANRVRALGGTFGPDILDRDTVTGAPSPAWPAFLASLRAGRFDMTVCYSLERMFRSGEAMCDVMVAAAAGKVGLAFVREDIVTDGTKGMDLAAALRIVHGMYVGLMSETSRQMHVRRRLQGLPSCKPMGFSQAVLEEGFAAGVSNAALSRQHGVPRTTVVARRRKWESKGAPA